MVCELTNNNTKRFKRNTTKWVGMHKAKLALKVY
jgi:hypothetical protein